MTSDRLVRFAHTLLGAIDNRGELPLGCRTQLRRTIEADPHTLEVWPWMEITCAELSLQIWKQTYPSDPLARELVQAARDQLGNRRATASRSWLANAKTALDDLFSNGEERWPAVYAGFAALAAAKTAPTHYQPERSADVTDLDIPPEDWDACYLASLAIVGFATWERPGGDGERRAYWTWYLRQCVPDAIKSAKAQ